MADRKISGSISPRNSITGSVTGGSGGGTKDHDKLINRDLANQHPISAISNLRAELDSKLDSKTALPLIEEAIKYKAKGLFYDINKELAKKSYWYLTSEIDETTGQGTKASIISGPYDLGQGGGGGGGGVTEVTLEVAIDPTTGKKMWPANISVKEGETECIIGVNWASLRDSKPTGKGTLYVYVDGTIAETKSAAQGLVTFDISKYIKAGENKVEVKVIDAYSTSKNFIDTITGVELRLSSNFNDSVSQTGNINFSYTPSGNIKKYVYFFIDGNQYWEPEIVETSGEQWNKLLPSSLFGHGSHTLKVYFTCTIDGEEIKSNVLFYDIIYYQPGVSTPIIASPFETPASYEQYTTFNIKYRVYTPNKNTSTVYLSINGEVKDTVYVDTQYKLWELRFDSIGTYILEIRSGSASRLFRVTTTECTIHVEPVTQNLALSLSSYGRKQDEEEELRKKWDYHYIDVEGHEAVIEGKLSGFNWASNGWVNDSTTDGTALRLSGDARLSIEYKPFETDFTGPNENGKTFEFEIATSDVKRYEARIGECLDGTDTITSSQWYAGEDTRTERFIVKSVNKEVFISKVLPPAEDTTYIFVFNGTNWILNNDTEHPISFDSLKNDYGITLEETGPNPGSGNHYLSGDKAIIYYTISGCGFYITPQLAKLQSNLTSLSTQYKENEKVKLTFVVESKNEKTYLMYMYINGVMSGVRTYSDTDSFKQTPAKFITFGSNDATLDIYTIRIYNQPLTRKQVVNNWIADTRDVILKNTRYKHNDIFVADTGKITPTTIESLKNLPYLIADLPELPKAKKDRKYATITYVNPAYTEKSFTAEQARMDVQGTSSSGYFKKNFKIKYEGGFYDNNLDWSEEYKIRDKNSKKEHLFTYKADVASSEGANNVELVRYFEDSKNWFSPAESIQDPEDTAEDLKTKNRIRVGIDGLPIVMFHKSDATTTSFYGKMNFNNDKDNKSTYGFKSGDESWEFLHNTSDLVLFKSDDLTSIDPETGNPAWMSSFESRYPEEAGEDDHPYGTLPSEREKLQDALTWVVSTNTAKATGALLPTPVKYGQVTYTHDTAEYRLAKFKYELEDRFDKTSTLFYYLYTELFLMVDSRAKNAMMTWMQERKVESGKVVPIKNTGRWYWYPYDMDTALGINNEGLLVYNYDKEDTDYQAGAYIFNGQDSVFWVNVRKAFADELSAMYNTLRSGGSEDRVQWSYDNIEKRYEEHQAVWPENLFNEDSYEKYLYPYIYNKDTTYLGMAQGSKEQQRKWWLYNRFKYLDSKYHTGDASSNHIMIRPYWSHAPYKAFATLEEYAGKDVYGQSYYILFNAGTEHAEIIAFDKLTPEEKAQVIPGTTVAYTRNVFNFKPYINCYAAVRIEKDNTILSVRADMGKDNIIKAPETWNVLGKDAVIWFDSADLLEDIGDLSVFKPGYVDLSKATKLKRLIVGSSDPGFNNTITVGLNVGANHLLTYIDARNCSMLGAGSGVYVTPTIDLSNCYSIEEVYFENTQIKSVTFPVGGNLKVAHLPETLTNLTIRKHPNLTDFSLAGTKFLNTLWLEDIPSSAIDTYDYVMNMPAESSVRLMGIKEDYSSLGANGYQKVEALYNKLDTLHGLDDKGASIDKAQISGTIKLQSIPYAQYLVLTARYDVKIDAPIICTVKFYTETLNTQTAQYEWTQFSITQEVRQGRSAENPGIPKKTPTLMYYYEFKEWNKSYINVQTDLDIYAQFNQFDQKYTIKFDKVWEGATWTDETKSQTIVKYNDLVADPSSFLDWNKSVASLAGWYTAASGGTIFDFSKPYHPTTIGYELILYAHWVDTESPVIEPLVWKSSNTYIGIAHDTVSITDYRFVDNGVATEWIENPGVDGDKRYCRVEHTVTAAGTSEFWVRDTTHEQSLAINVYKLERTTPLPAGISSLIVTEVITGTEITDRFALSGTTINVAATIDSHYQELKINFEYDDASVRPYYVDPNQYPMGKNYPLEQNITIRPLCTAKTYLVHFELFDKGDPEKAKDQYIVYNNLVTKPAPQVYMGEYITGWYKDEACTSGNAWNFDVDKVDQNIILYAKWEEYNDPTEFTINNIPEGELVSIRLYQTIAEGVEVDWGHGNVSTSNNVGNVTITKPEAYPTSGPYTIKVRRRKGLYILGHENATGNVINPISILTNISFAYDINRTFNGAFMNATGLTQVNLTSYMDSVADNAFYNCTNLESVNFAASIKTIGDYAFYGTKLIAAILPDTVESLGDYAFMNCLSLANVKLSSTLRVIGEEAFSNCGALTAIDCPKSVIELKDSAFKQCESLSKVILRAETMMFGSTCFNLCMLLKKAGPIDHKDHETFNIEFAVKESIPAHMFEFGYTQSGLTDIILPTTIKSIGDGAFLNTKIQTINLKDCLNLTSIGAHVFERTRLVEVDVPATVNFLGESVFNYIMSLQTINLWTSSVIAESQAVSPTWFWGVPKEQAGADPKLHIPGGVEDPEYAYGSNWNKCGSNLYLAYDKTLS